MVEVDAGHADAGAERATSCRRARLLVRLAVAGRRGTGRVVGHVAGGGEAADEVPDRHRRGPDGSAAASGSCTSTEKRWLTDSSLMASIIASKSWKPSRWYSMSGSRWAMARRPMPSWR